MDSICSVEQLVFHRPGSRVSPIYMYMYAPVFPYKACRMSVSPWTQMIFTPAYKPALGQPWVWSISDFIFLGAAYDGGSTVLSLTVSFSYRQCTVSVLSIAELARGADVEEIRDVNRKPENRISVLKTKSGFAYSVNEIRIYLLKSICITKIA